MNRGGNRSSAFAGGRQSQSQMMSRGGGGGGAMVGPERATVINANFAQRRSGGGYGGNRPRSAGGPPPEVARILNNFKRSGPTYGAAAAQNNSYKDFQRKYVPEAQRPSQQQVELATPAPARNRLAASLQAARPGPTGALPSQSRPYVKMSQQQQQQAVQQPAPIQQQQQQQQPQSRPGATGTGRRPTVDLRKFQRDYVPVQKPAAVPAVAPKKAPQQSLARAIASPDPEPAEFIEAPQQQQQQQQMPLLSGEVEYEGGDEQEFH